MFNVNKCNLDEAVTIYPYKNNVTSRLEFQESVIKLALKTACFQQQHHGQYDDFNFLFVASAHVESESSQISLIIEQFDKGQKKYTTSQTPSLAPSASIPDALYIPARLSHQSSLTEQNNNTPVKNTACDSLVTYYMNSIDYLTSYFQKFCTSIDSITKLMSLSASIYFNDTSKPTGPFNQYSTLLNANFELVTLGNRFEANQIQAMPIIETSLLKTLQSTLNFFLKPKTGYCALYKNENIVLLMDSEPKATKVPLMGIWVSGVQDINHPLVWAACIRYTFSQLLANKSSDFQGSFVIILFPSTSKRPEFYLCKSQNSNLEFTLFNGFSQLIVNKSNNENRCITIDMSEVKDGYNFKLFSNSISQTMRQDIYGQHQLLESNYDPKSSLYSINDEFGNNSNAQYHFQKSISLSDNDIQPRSLSALSNNWTQNTNSSMEKANSHEPNGGKLATTSPIPFINGSNELSGHATNVNAGHQFKTPAIPPSTNEAAGNIVVGSYHSVSDISVLSDNDPDDSIYSLNATTCSSMQNNSSQNSSSNYFSKTKPMVSQSDDFEFLRPKEPPLPTKSNLLASSTSRLEQKMKYNQHVYSNTSNSLSCSSNGGSMSSLSPSPTPSFNNSSTAPSFSNLNRETTMNRSPVPSMNQTNPMNKSKPETNPYENSKSILFGIPRGYAPMPTISADNSINSPFVNTTMNNCDDMSLYQPMKKLEINPRTSTLEAELQSSQGQKNVPKPTLSSVNPTNNFTSNKSSSDLKEALVSSNCQNQRSLEMNSNQSNLVSASSSSMNTSKVYSFGVNGQVGVGQQFAHSNGKSLNTTATEFSNKSDQNFIEFKKEKSQIEMLTYLHPNEIAKQLMNEDAQLQAYFKEMHQLQKHLSSISQYSNHTNNNSEVSTVSHSINQLYGKIDNRKNIIKVNFFNTYQKFQQQLSSQSNHSNSIGDIQIMNKSYENSFNTSIEKQRLSASNSHESGSSEYNSIVYSVNSTNTSNFVNVSPKPSSSSNLLVNQNSIGNLQNSNGQFNQTGYGNIEKKFEHRQSTSFDKKSDEETEEEDEDEEEDESVNVFGAALQDYKHQQWQQTAHQKPQQSEPSKHSEPVSICDDQHLLHKFNYVSLLLDDYCDKNTSMNTKALAHKYLKEKHTNESQVYSQAQDYGSFNAESKFKPSNLEMFNSCYNPSTTSIDSTKYDKLFQYYTEQPSMYEESDQQKSTIHNEQQSMVYNHNCYRSCDNSSTMNNTLIDNDQNKNYPTANSSEFGQKLSVFSSGSNKFPAFPNSSSTCNSSAQLNGQFNMRMNRPTSTPRFSSYENNNSMQHQNLGNSYDTSSFNASSNFPKKNDSKNSDRTSEDSDDTDSENDVFDKKQKPYHQKSECKDDEDEEEIWVFRKPQQQVQSKAEAPDAFKESLNKLKQRKRLERQKRRNEEKDFSDQDEVDRDVTTVLDIEKLKRLPKLL